VHVLCIKQNEQSTITPIDYRGRTGQLDVGESGLKNECATEVQPTPA
jgi:hypothetical protein